VAPRERQKSDKQGQQDDRERMKRGPQDPGAQRNRREPEEGSYDDEGEQDDER
jgi:hypothetical protein